MPSNVFCFYIYTRHFTLLNLTHIPLYLPHGIFHHYKTIKVNLTIFFFFFKEGFTEELLAKTFESVPLRGSRVEFQRGGVRLTILTWVPVVRTGTVSFH